MIDDSNTQVDPRSVGPSADALPEVTDADRHRYGLLLDRAAERGLLSPYEYELRLGDLAAADTVETMQRIVSELPAFAGVPRSGPTASSAVFAPATVLATSPAHRPANRWLVLAVVVVAMAAALVLLAVYAHHVAAGHADATRAPVADLVRLTLRL